MTLTPARRRYWTQLFSLIEDILAADNGVDADLLIATLKPLVLEMYFEKYGFLRLNDTTFKLFGAYRKRLDVLDRSNSDKFIADTIATARGPQLRLMIKHNCISVHWLRDQYGIMAHELWLWIVERMKFYRSTPTALYVDGARQSPVYQHMSYLFSYADWWQVMWMNGVPPRAFAIIIQ
jgi:hypothetical protein